MGYSYGYGFGHTWRGKKRVTAVVAGGGSLLVGEANGFATDFLYPTDAQRVALKASSALTYYPVDSFYQNVGTSPRMVWDVNGVLGWSPHNRLVRSSEFDNASWIKGNSSVVVNAAIAPNGLMEADKVIDNSAVSTHGVYIGASSPIAGTFSIYVKAGEKSHVILQDSGNRADGFNLTTGTTFTLVSGPIVTTGNPVIQSVGNGWWRCSIPVLSDVNTVFVHISNGTTNPVYVGDGASGIYVWGAQLNNGAIPTAYLPTTTAARFGLAIDYDPVTHVCKGLLSEPAGTNLLVRSSEFDNAGWNKAAVTVGANAVAAPNGLTEADAVIPTAGSVSAYMYENAALTAAAHTLSYYVKNGTLGNNWVCIGSDAGGGVRAWFNLATGAKGTSSASPTSWTITSVGNGWYRIDVTFTAAAGGAPCYLMARPADGSSGNVTGDGVSPAFYVWGAQVEAGTVATSPIPTFGASATRAGNNYSLSTAAINYSATAGSWWMDINLPVQIPTAILLLQTTTNYVILSQGGAASIDQYDGATNLQKLVSPVGVHKLSSVFAVNDRALTADGLAVVSSAAVGSGFLSPGANIYLGNNASGGSNSYGYIRKIRYVPRRKTNPEMVTETT